MRFLILLLATVALAAAVDAVVDLWWVTAIACGLLGVGYGQLTKGD